MCTVSTVTVSTVCGTLCDNFLWMTAICGSTGGITTVFGAKRAVSETVACEVVNTLWANFFVLRFNVHQPGLLRLPDGPMFRLFLDCLCKGGS